MTAQDTLRTFDPGAGRPHIAAILARSDEARLLAVLDYLAEPKHRAAKA